MANALAVSDKAVVVKVDAQQAVGIVELLIRDYLSADMINNLNIPGVNVQGVKVNNFALAISDNEGGVTGNIFIDGNFPIIGGIKENVGLEARVQNNGLYKIALIPSSLEIKAGFRIGMALNALNIEKLLSGHLDKQNTELPKILNSRPEFAENETTLKLARLNFEGNQFVLGLTKQ